MLWEEHPSFPSAPPLPITVTTGAVHFLTNTGLFAGQSQAFFNYLFSLAAHADQAARECDGD